MRKTDGIYNMFMLEQVVAKNIFSDTFADDYERCVNAFLSRKRRLLT